MISKNIRDINKKAKRTTKSRKSQSININKKKKEYKKDINSKKVEGKTS